MNFLLRKEFWLFVLYGSATAALIGFVYFLTLKTDYNKDYSLIYREIETPAKMILNGYLGQWFRFKTQGNLNWLVIPFLLKFFITWKSQENWKKGMVVTYLLAFCLIGAKGFFNTRYQITLFPLTLFLVCTFLWDFVNSKTFKPYKVLIYLGLIGLLAFNNFYSMFFNRSISVRQIKVKNVEKSFSFYKFSNEILEQIEAGATTMSEFIENVERVVQKTFRYIQAFLILSRSVNYELKWGKEVSYPSLKYIKENNWEGKFLVNNLPHFYYYTGKKGIYYWAGDDKFYFEGGQASLLTNRTLSQTSSFLLDSLACKYVFSLLEYNKYNPKFAEFLRAFAKPIFLDASEFIIYELQRDSGLYEVQPVIDSLKFRISKSTPPYFINLR